MTLRAPIGGLTDRLDFVQEVSHFQFADVTTDVSDRVLESVSEAPPALRRHLLVVEVADYSEPGPLV